MPKVLLVPFPGHDVSGLWKLTAVLAMVVVFRASSTSTEELAWWNIRHRWVRNLYSATGWSSSSADWTHCPWEHTQLLRWQGRYIRVFIKGRYVAVHFGYVIYGEAIYWVISLFGLVLRSAELLSETTVNHSPPGIIIVVFTCPQIFIIIIIIIIDNRILNFLDCILIGIFHRENVLNFHGRKNGRHFERRDAVSTFLNTFIFSEILPACAKEYLTAARYYCQAEVKVRDRVAAVDAIFPPISRSDIISKQYGGRRVGLQMCNCDSFAKMS